MALSEANRTILANTLKEWTKCTTEREGLTRAATELSTLTRKVVQECLAFIKAQTIDVLCDALDAMKIIGISLRIDPVIDATFPNVKASVVLKCAGSTRAILVNPNLTISTGGVVMTFDQLKKEIPDPLITNAADFVRDRFMCPHRREGRILLLSVIGE